MNSRFAAGMPGSRAPQRAAQRPPDLALRALLGLGVAGVEEPPVHQRAERQRRERRRPRAARSAWGSATRSSQFMIMSAAHSLGSNGLVGVRSAAR